MRPLGIIWPRWPNYAETYNLICEMAATYPGYGLAKHKGYGTAQHKRALAELGPTPLHRFSFAPVKAAARQVR